MDRNAAHVEPEREELGTTNSLDRYVPVCGTRLARTQSPDFVIPYRVSSIHTAAKTKWRSIGPKSKARKASMPHERQGWAQQGLSPWRALKTSWSSGDVQKKERIFFFFLKEGQRLREGKIRPTFVKDDTIQPESVSEIADDSCG